MPQARGISEHALQNGTKSPQLSYNRCLAASGIIASERASSPAATTTSCPFFFSLLSRDWCAVAINFLPGDRATRSTCHVFGLIPEMLSVDCESACRVFPACRKKMLIVTEPRRSAITVPAVRDGKREAASLPGSRGMCFLGNAKISRWIVCRRFDWVILQSWKVS